MSYVPSNATLPHCELGFFWDAVKQKCRKKVLQIRVMSIPGTLPDGHGGISPHHGHQSDFFNSASGFLFTLFYIAAIIFVVKLYFRYLCCWRPRNDIRTLHEMGRRRVLFDASRLRSSPTNRFTTFGHNSAHDQFVVAFPPAYSEPATSSSEKPPSYEEATKGS